MIDSLKKEFTIGCTYGLDTMLKSYKVTNVTNYPKRCITLLCSDGVEIIRNVDYSGDNGEMLTINTDMTHSHILRSNWLKIDRF